MDPITAITSTIQSILGIIPEPRRKPDFSTQRERVDWYISQPQDNSQVFILGGIGVIVLVLVVLAIFKKK